MPDTQPTSPSLTSWTYPAAVAADCDETLTTGGRLLPSVLLARQRLRRLDIPFVIVTGRAAGFAWTLFELLGADAVVAENGGILFERRNPERPLSVGDSVPAAPLTAGGWARGRDLFETLKDEGLLPSEIQPTMDNAFRLTDFTFPVDGLTHEQLVGLKQRIAALGADFVYSTIHAHIMPQGQTKAAGLTHWARRQGLSTDGILTIGDSPNDETLFDPALFSLTWGVAGLQRYSDQLRWRPRHLTSRSAGQGFAEMVCRITDGQDLLPRWIALDESWHGLLFLDGICPACTAMGRWLAGRQSWPADWQLAALQGQTAARLLPEGLRSNPANPNARPDALTLWKDGKILLGAEAILEVLTTMGGAGRWLAAALRLIPRPLRGWGYRVIARIRFVLPSSSPQDAEMCARRDDAAAPTPGRWLP